jgi:Tfp pilus assembly protein PilF
MLRVPRPFSFNPVKTPNTYRIVVLGESAAYGDPEPAFGFSRYLEVILRERYPGVDFQVINTSITATNSHAILPITKDMSRYQPDLFLAYIGSNEVVGPFGAGTVFTSTGLPLPLIRAQIWFNSTHVGQWVSLLKAPPRDQWPEWRGMEMFLSQHVTQESPELPSVYRNFRANLQDSVAAAQKAGARMLLSTVVTNERDCAPFASEHRPGLTPAELRQWTEHYEKGIALQAASDAAGALLEFRAALKIDSKYAELHFRMARSLEGTGDFDQARQEYLLARDADALRFRADSRINDIIRKVATGKGGNVMLLDAEKEFAAMSPHGSIGVNLMWDHVHLNPHGNYLLAMQIADTIAGQLPQQVRAKADQGTTASQEECDRSLALTGFDRAHMAMDLMQRMQHPPFTYQANHEELVNYFGPMTASTESPQETAQQYQYALQHQPKDYMLHLNYGNFLGRFNRAEAMQEYRQARPYTDMPFTAPDGTVVQ